MTRRRLSKRRGDKDKEGEGGGGRVVGASCAVLAHQMKLSARSGASRGYKATATTPNRAAAAQLTSSFYIHHVVRSALCPSFSPPVSCFVLLLLSPLPSHCHALLPTAVCRFTCTCVVRFCSFCCCCCCRRRSTWVCCGK